MYEYTLQLVTGYWVVQQCGYELDTIILGSIISYLRVQYHMSFHVILNKISYDIGNISTPDIRCQVYHTWYHLPDKYRPIDI